MEDEKDILRYCGDMGEGDDWVQRLTRVNRIVDDDRRHACTLAQALADVDMPQKYRDRIAYALKRAEQQSATSGGADV